MRSMTFIVSGNPTPLARPRLSHYSIYDSQKQEKLIHSIELSHQMGNEPLFVGPLLLNVIFYMPAGKAKRRILTPHFFKPDCDNLIKYICDICQSVVFQNDCTIYKIIAEKIYDTKARTVFTITEYSEGNHASA